LGGEPEKRFAIGDELRVFVARVDRFQASNRLRTGPIGQKNQIGGTKKRRLLNVNVGRICSDQATLPLQIVLFFSLTGGQ